MYRILSASADTYITNRVISNSRSLDSNVGQAGSLDLFTLFDESRLTSEPSGSTRELSRILIKFDYSDLTATDVSDVNFTASLVLKDIYGGQTTPSNFTLVLYPLSKSFDEGRGSDIVSYRDLDTANFLKASTGVSWVVTGANSLGNAGQTVDVMVSGNLGSGLQALGAYQTFTRGDEDASFNITQLVSASVVGILPNYGYRISFIESQENEDVTRFVKRFGTRHAYNKSLAPKVNILNTADRIYDTSGKPEFNISQSFYAYNHVNGNLVNFYSGSSQITGSNSLLLKLEASKSISYMTSSYQANFSASINHLTTSVVYFSQSFSASLYSSPGIYNSDFILDLYNNSSLNSFVTKNEISFKGTFISLDGTVKYTDNNWFNFKKHFGVDNNAQEKNYIINAVNLQDSYVKEDKVRIRVFVQDMDNMQTARRYASKMQSVILSDMRWRLKKAYNHDIVIPFSVGTKMSTDSDGMYFDLYIQDLDINEVYELEFVIKNDFGKDMVVKNKGFIFKVVS